MSKRQNAPAKASSSFISKLPAIMIGAILLAFVVVPIGAAILHRPEKPAPATYKASPAQAPSPDRTVDSVTALMTALYGVVQGDTEAEELLAFCRDHGHFGLLIGGGSVAVLDRKDKRRPELGRDFVIVPSSLEERRAGGVMNRGALENQWVFDTNNGTMYVPLPGTYTELMLGAVFAHELVHVRDLLTGVERQGSSGAEWFEGERRAYTLEIRLLDRATDGAFSKEVGRVLDGRPDLVEVFRNGDITMMPGPEIDRVLSVMPPTKDQEERAVRTAIGAIALMYGALDRVQAPPEMYHLALRTMM